MTYTPETLRSLATHITNQAIASEVLGCAAAWESQTEPASEYLAAATALEEQAADMKPSFQAHVWKKIDAMETAAKLLRQAAGETQRA